MSDVQREDASSRSVAPIRQGDPRLDTAVDALTAEQLADLEREEAERAVHRACDAFILRYGAKALVQVVLDATDVSGRQLQDGET